MTKPLLTVGFAIYRDTDGGWFTLQSLHAHHPRVEILVVDNAPEPDRRIADCCRAVGGRYLHRPDLHGTSAPRDAVFRLAQTEWAMCVDAHVLLESGAIQALLDYAITHPESNDLIQGPMVHDDGRSLSTHWRPTAPPGLWGTWDAVWETPDGIVFTIGDSVHDHPDGHFVRRLDDGTPLDDIAKLIRFGPGDDLDALLSSRGYVKGGTRPFDIPMQGLGLFAMRKAAWPGFHPKFQGFGGEEGYIHEKVRQRGGKCLCLPALRWRHKFRHMEHGAPPPPYRLAKEDHVWNLLLGHRELGIDALPQIRQVFGQGLPAGVFEKLAADAEKVQPFGVSGDRKRLKLLGCWYSNNSAPLPLLQKSLGTIQRAVSETMHHDVQVTTSAWQAIPGNPFPCAVGRPEGIQGHAAIVAQMRRCLEQAGDWPYDGVVFLEHDVLYSPGHFDRMGDALATGAPVVANDDYQGLNATGFLKVKELHQPMHQMAMRHNVALANLDRAEEECKRQGWAYLEPQGDRFDWVRLPPIGLTPAIHVNW